MNSSQDLPAASDSDANGHNNTHNGGSVLGVIEEVIRVGQAMGFSMEGCTSDLEHIISLGSKTKKEWVKGLVNANKLNFLAIQETKLSNVSDMEVKFLMDKRLDMAIVKKDIVTELIMLDQALDRGDGVRWLHIRIHQDLLDLLGPELCDAVEYFFIHGRFSKGCNSSFIALIPKILANRLALVIADLVSDTQSAFIAGRHILDGPFILDEILNWCKRKNKHAMFFKVDFAKAYDSVRWDFLIDVLEAFGFGQAWCNWIRGILYSAKASVLINGSPSNEFTCYRGLKQGDPLAPYLFILVMEALHVSFTKAIEAGIFKGLLLPGSISISHLFYADDAMFLGEWSADNIKGILNILKSFYLASGLRINISKSQLLGVGVSRGEVERAACSIGTARCFEANGKNSESFFNGVNQDETKITWVSWDKVLASKKHGGLGVSSYFALNLKSYLKSHGFDFGLIGREAEWEWGGVCLSFTFRRPIRGGIESQQMDSLNDLLQTIVLSDSNDRWVCDLAGDGSFCVKDIRNRIDDVILPSTPIPTRWLKIIPIKVNIFMWRARLGCLPTRDNLVRRGVLVDSTACPSCSVNEESVNHTLFCCDLARTVLQRICRWWNLALLDWISFQEWHEWFLSIRMSSTNKLLLEGVFSVAWWILWRFRNRLIFEDIPPKRSEIFDDIVLLSFNWCSNRCRKTFSWTEWLKNPHCISL
ncbi:RNA-directed DNA polymerase, eukaryota [Tanacetum coccineum]